MCSWGGGGVEIQSLLVRKNNSPRRPSSPYYIKGEPSISKFAQCGALRTVVTVPVNHVNGEDNMAAGWLTKINNFSDYDFTVTAYDGTWWPIIAGHQYRPGEAISVPRRRAEAV